MKETRSGGGRMSCCLAFLFSLFVLLWQVQGRNETHLPWYHQPRHSQHHCGRLLQLYHFQWRCSDLPLEGQLRSRAAALGDSPGTGQGQGCEDAGRVRYGAKEHWTWVAQVFTLGCSVSFDCVLYLRYPKLFIECYFSWVVVLNWVQFCIYTHTPFGNV